MTRRYEHFSKYTGKTTKEVPVETTPGTETETQSSNKENIMKTENQKPEINSENIQGLIEAAMIRILGRVAESEEDFAKLMADPEYQELSQAAMQMAVAEAAREMEQRLIQSGVADAMKELGTIENSLKDEVAKILNKPRKEVKTGDFVDAAQKESGIIFGMKMMVSKLSQVRDAFEKFNPEETKGREEIDNQLSIMNESIKIIEEQLAAEKAAEAKAQAEAVKAAKAEAEATAKTQSTQSENKEKTMENNQQTKQQAFEEARDERVKEAAQEAAAEMRDAAKEASEKGFFERHKNVLLAGVGAVAAVGIGYGIYSFFSGEEAASAVASVATDAAEAVTEATVEATVSAAFANLLK